MQWLFPDRSRSFELAWHAYGYFSSDTGVGRAARYNLAHFARAEDSVCAYDIETGDDRSTRFDFIWDNRKAGAKPRQNRIPVNILFMPPPTLGSSLLRNHPDALFRGRFNVMLPFWELTHLPSDWEESIGHMDAVLAPTRFVQRALESAQTETPVIYFPQAFEPAPISSGNRRRFKLPETGFLFLCAFDMSSDPWRKNPEAAIKAFIEAFPPDEHGPDVHLVVKVNNPTLLERTQERLGALKASAAPDRRIHLWLENVAEEDLHSFFATFDAYISLHRAEGLGLILMEMMGQGKPILATGWSGNMDFCTPKNCCLIGYDLVPVQIVHPWYEKAMQERRDLTWAEPRIPEAAEAMRDLVEQPERAGAIGRAARKTMEARGAMDLTPQIEELRELVRSWEGTSPGQSAFFRKMSKEVRRRHPTRRWRHGVHQLKDRLSVWRKLRSI